MNQLRIALDWTPNVNHIGIFTALERGVYAEKGVEVEIVHPGLDNYALTPAKKLELNQVQLAITPMESVISLNHKEQAVDAVAIYAILQKDLSSIATLRESGIDRPAKLDNTIYASYNARYEDHIVQALIRNDGGKGEIILVHPEKLGIWNTLLDEIADATWIFDNWEGVEAQEKGVKLNCFRLCDFDIPYSYSPVITARKGAIEANEPAYKAFVSATAEGYQYAIQEPVEASKILWPHLTPHDQEHIDLRRALELTIGAFNAEGGIGRMRENRVATFLQWLVHHRLESKAILNQTFFTNALFD